MRHLLRNLKDLTFSPVLLENITTLDKTRCKSFNVLHLPMMSLLLLLANMSTMHFAQPTMTITTSSSVNLFILIILFYFCCCCYYSDWSILMLRINTSYRYRQSWQVTTQLKPPHTLVLMMGIKFSLVPLQTWYHVL